MPRDARKSMNQCIARLTDVWDEMGVKEEMRADRLETVKKHIEVMFNQMITEEVQLKEDIEAKIQNGKNALKKLCHELSLKEYTVDEDMTILQIEKDLRLKVQEMEREKAERLVELKLLQREDMELCNDLCVTPYYVPTGSIPSRQQLVELREHIKARTGERKERLQVFVALRAEIRLCMDEMGRDPENSLEQEAIGGDDEAFFLTKDNIQALTVLKVQLDLRKEALLSTLSELKQKVHVLWNRLQVPQNEQELLPKVAVSPISDEIKQWERELVHLEELKKTNLKVVFQKTREELQLYWDKCFFSAEQRQEFTPYYEEDVTEGLLCKHDEEVVRLKLHYEKCKEMLEAVIKWETNWEQFVVLEKKASDPNRFSNRGGTLLKQEKDRAKLQKLLSRLEEELKTRIEAWEADHGYAFLVRGCRFVDYVASQWETHKRQKEREKQDKTNKKDETTAYKTPIKRPAGSSAQGTPCKSRKITVSSAIMSKTVESNINSGSTSASLTVTGKPPLATIRTPSKTRDTLVRTPLHDSNKQALMSSTEPGTYSDFKEAVTKKSSNTEAVFNSTVNENL
ncbi:hypothetical protein FKM82_000927 [Ascaphus truei]